MCRVRTCWWKDAGIEDFEQLMRVRRATVCSEANAGAGMPAGVRKGRDFVRDESSEREKLVWAAAICREAHLFRRHPGPGLGIRIIGKITMEKIKILQEADHIFISELNKSNLYEKIWQAYAALLPIKTVGVMGDSRTYENICLLRAVISEDGMTADYFNFPKLFLDKISNKIINGVKGINRVVYDITSKPPSTIELE